MVAVPSTMLQLGTPVPDFSLADPDGVRHSPGSAAGTAGLLVAFVCNHCPYVVHVAPRFGELSQRWAEAGVGVIGIVSNDLEAYPQDGPDHMITFAESNGWSFPYVIDTDQTVAQAFRAACTPDFFLFDAEGRLAYRGQFDDSRPKSDTPVTGEDLDRAVQAVLAGQDAPAEQVPSMGCNIKWKPGNEPEYFR